MNQVRVIKNSKPSSAKCFLFHFDHTFRCWDIVVRRVPNCSTILYRCLSHTLGPSTRAASLTNHNLVNSALVSNRQRLRLFFFTIATIKHTRFLQKMLVKLLRCIIHSSIDLQLYFKVLIYLQNKFWYRLRSECIIESKFSTILWISNIWKFRDCSKRTVYKMLMYYLLTLAAIIIFFIKYKRKNLLIESYMAILH